MKSERKLDDSAKELFLKHQEYLSTLTPEEKKQYFKDTEEVKEKTKHCVDEDGLTHPEKVNIWKFLYLKEIKETDHVNEILIRTLAFYSNMNIILRYLLIEAAINNKTIERILRETRMGNTKFFSIPNDLKAFNNKSDGYIVEENRLSASMLAYRLFFFDISNPEEASRKRIVQKTEIIIDEEIQKIMVDFSSSCSDVMQEMLEMQKSSITTNKLIEDIAFILKSFMRSHVENQLNSKHAKPEESYILYLNGMFWMRENSFRSVLNSFLYFPKLLLNLNKDSKDTVLLMTQFTQKEKAKWKPKIKINIRSLPQKTKEELQSKIVKRIEKFLDKGITQEQAFYKLSEESLNELGYSLTKGQIEGQYKRHQDDINSI